MLTNVALDHTRVPGRDGGGDLAREAGERLRAGSILILGSEDPRVREDRPREMRAGRGPPDRSRRCRERGSCARLAPYAARDVAPGGSGGRGAARARAFDRGASAVGRRRRRGLAGPLRGPRGGRRAGGGRRRAQRLRRRAASSAMGRRTAGGRLGWSSGSCETRTSQVCLPRCEKEARVLVLTRPEGERAADPARVLARAWSTRSQREAGYGWRPTP